MVKVFTRIHKYHPLYSLLKLVNKFAYFLFYKKIEVSGKNNIPYGNPIIFTPNHQNALMDALAVLFTCGLDTVFMARADIFRNKRQAKFLNFLKILPIYRIRDGAEELSKNAHIFDLALVVLEDNKSVCLMPEGNHGDKRRLRPLVKGSFRIAFNAQEKFGDKMAVKIVPVGIDFEHYHNIQQDLLINYGQAIEIKEYMGMYAENQPKAINKLKERLSEELKKVIIHIENEEYYNMYNELRSIYNERMRNRMGILKKTHYYRFLADKEMIHILDENLLTDPDRIKMLNNLVNEYAEGVKTLNLRYWVIDKKGFSFLRMVLTSMLLIPGFPLFLFGWFNNFIPNTLPQRIVKKIKDFQFHSSVKFVVAFIVFPVYYAIMAVIIGLATGPAWIPWIYIPFGFLAGYFALYYSFWYKKLRASFKYRIGIQKSDSEIISIMNLHESIISVMNKIVEDYQKRFLPEYKKI
jgi:1-acyl-sn-glycerol-3-phosphate acyltransferase